MTFTQFDSSFKQEIESETALVWLSSTTPQDNKIKSIKST